MMAPKASFSLLGRNPDVLTCIANLSNDEVFTPPAFANQMLDTLEEAWAERHNGANIWADASIRFLDPCTKTGVFLREITTRLTQGLAAQIPDLRERVNHILTRQVFGIGITRLTSLLARRSLYCSKHAKGAHSVASTFKNDDGNIWFQTTEHTWTDGKCTFCGASEVAVDKGAEHETHAYAFIHSDNLEARLNTMFGGQVQFDVIIGNPPYQLSDASDSASASPIYNKFIDQAIALDPRFVCMVTPSRWFVGGKGLDEFRARMLADRRVRSLVDFIVDKDAFPKINVNGGISYFVWDRDHTGDCSITTVERGGLAGEPVSRALDEFDVFVRRNESAVILRKVLAVGEETFDKHVSPRKPFGLPTNFFGASSSSPKASIKLHSSGKVTWVSRSQIPVRAEWIDAWKVLVGRATDGNENYPLPIWDKRGPFVAGPGEACTETYLVAAVVSSQRAAKRIVTYMNTTFFRFLVSLRKITQDNKAEVFAFVPDLPMDRDWSDSLLATRYGLGDVDVSFMRSMIRDAEFTG